MIPTTLTISSGRLHVDIIEAPRQSLLLSSFCLWPFCHCCQIFEAIGGKCQYFLRWAKNRKPFKMLSCYWVLFILSPGLSNSFLLLKGLSAFIYTVKTYFEQLLRNRRNSYLETCFYHVPLPVSSIQTCKFIHCVNRSKRQPAEERRCSTSSLDAHYPLPWSPLKH